MADLQRSFQSFFLREAAPPAAAPPAAALEASVAKPATFSAFNPEHMGRVGGLMLNFGAAMRQAATPEAGTEAVLALAQEAAKKEPLALVQHALGIFVTHAGKSFPGAPRLPVPPMVFKAAAPPAPPAAPVAESLTGPVTLAGEDLVHWWREDLFLNEHHRHWHIVYSTVGVFNGTALQFKSRQGEVFVYMHEQMLARYDTERVTAGLDPVEPLGDLAAVLGVGYDPNAREPANIGYVPREDGKSLPASDATDLENRKQSIRKVLAGGEVFGQPATLTADLIGTLMESNLSLFGPTISTQAELDAKLAAMAQEYQMHNFGHGAIANVPTPASRVMNNPHTSLKDPVFWRWHRMIDDLAYEHASTLPPHEPDAGAGISLRKGYGADSPDVLIIGETRLRAAAIDLNAEDRDAAIASYVDGNFGPAKWGDPPDPNAISDELRTGTLEGHFVYEREVVDPVTGDSAGTKQLDFRRVHLISERFVTVVRAENTGPNAIQAMLRVFICADHFLDLGSSPGDAEKRRRENRYWIELERIPVEVKPGRNVFSRVSDQSSVVRKLRGRAPWPTSAFTADDFGDIAAGSDPIDDYCDCGWPLNLHLPKGQETSPGMAFRIMAMLSPGVPGMDQGTCGSRAFCGAGFTGYPEVDGLNLGYPFDRPAPGGTLAMIAAAPNMAARSFRIRHDPALATDFGLPVS